MQNKQLTLLALLALVALVGCEKSGENDGFLTGETKVSSADEVDLTADIGEVAARQTAVKDAGVSDSSLTDYSCSTTDENGTKFYFVSFKSGDTSFEYKLRAADGGIFGANRQTAY